MAHTSPIQERIDSRQALWQALTMLEEGQPTDDVARTTGFHRLTLEKAVLAAKRRQELIREHLQSRGPVTSLLRYSERGPWGQGGYFGNCAGYLIVDLLDYLRPRSVFDPMEGSGTTGDVCFDLRVEYLGRDLRGGFDLLSGSLPDRKFDLIFWHPPYWPGHRYSDHPNDFSNAKNYRDYLGRVKEAFRLLADRLNPEGHLVLLIGDGRKNGVFYPIHAEIIEWRMLELEAILIKEGDHHRRARHYRYGPTSFIPTLHEYVLIFKADAS